VKFIELLLRTGSAPILAAAASSSADSLLLSPHLHRRPHGPRPHTRARRALRSKHGDEGKTGEEGTLGAEVLKNGFHDDARLYALLVVLDKRDSLQCCILCGRRQSDAWQAPRCAAAGALADTGTARGRSGACMGQPYPWAE